MEILFVSVFAVVPGNELRQGHGYVQRARWKETWGERNGTHLKRALHEYLLNSKKRKLGTMSFRNPEQYSSVGDRGRPVLREQSPSLVKAVSVMLPTSGLF